MSSIQCGTQRRVGWVGQTELNAPAPSMQPPAQQWFGVQAVSLTVGVPLGCALALGALFRPFKTFERKDRSGIVVQDPLPGLHHETISVNGLKLHLVRTCANDGNRKPVALLLHGFPEGWFSWRHQMEALREAGWCAVAMDLRGYGASDKPQDISSYRMRLLVGDVVGVIHTIAPPDTGRVTLVGHDWGSMIGWHVAHMYPELINRLAVLCFPHPQRFRCSQMSLDQLRRCWYIFAFQLPWIPELMLRAGDYSVFDSMFLKGPTACKRPGAVTAQQVERYKIAFSQPGALTGPINYYRALLDEATCNPDHGVQKALQRPLTMPVLLMFADQDAVLRPQLLHGTGEHVLNLRVHMLKNCSHWAQQDRPEEVNQVLKEFLMPAASQLPL